MKYFVATALAFLLGVAQGGYAPCITITVPDFLTADMTHCYDQQPLDICTPFNENDTEKVRGLINCTNYDTEYKVQALVAALNDAVAATLPEEDRNQSLYVTDFIVRWCSYGLALPSNIYNYTCEEYLAMVTVTCAAPVTLSVPDVNDLGNCAEQNEIANICMEGDSVTWQTFADLVALLRCVYFNIIPLLPYPEY
ncbi:uncharacterized protein LOC119464827 [Dermacentor silvarum]|uniref:uncharacterized protein LOC119464827 n=1 Tax=Dermacentor silvarum TaxID=543639 RepID=UPI0018989E0E|nr:uncharacterized protein LOC119464827 [Dermacentor silvarum]